MRNIASGRRVEINRWIMVSHHPQCREFKAARRNIGRAPARLALEHTGLRTGAGAAIRESLGNTAHDPPDDELFPESSDESAPTRSPLLVLDPSWSMGKESNLEEKCPNPDSPNRDRDLSDGPDSQRAKIGGATESGMEDQASSARRAIRLPAAVLVITAADEHLRREGQGPNRGWPANDIMYQMEVFRMLPGSAFSRQRIIGISGRSMGG